MKLTENVAAAPTPRVCSDGVRFWCLMAVIFVFKLVLEGVFFVGVVNQYGEECQFVSLAFSGQIPGESYWDAMTRYTVVQDWAQWKGDPGDMYPFRVSALYPNIWFVRLLGGSEWAISTWSMLTGVGSVLVVGLLGRKLGGNAMGLGAAVVLAAIPGHVLYSARVATDMPQLFYMATGICLLVCALAAGTVRRQLVFAAAAGVGFGLLYLAKLPPAFLALGWALLMPFGLAAFKDTETLVAGSGKWRQAAGISGAVLAGFLVVFLIENIAYHQLSGQWLLHWRIMGANAVNMADWRGKEAADFGFIRLWLPIGGKYELFAHSYMFARSFFPVEWFSDVYQAPIHGWSAALAVPSLLVLPFLRHGRHRLQLWVIGGFVLYFIYQEFLWLYPTWEDGHLNLTFVHKVHRFIFPCYIGIALVAGAGLAALGRWAKRLGGSRLGGAVPGVILVVYAVANLAPTAFFHERLRRSLADTRLICEMVRRHAEPGTWIYGAAGMEPFFRLLQYPGHYQWGYAVDRTPDTIGPGLAVVGGSNGIGLSPEIIFERYPVWLQPYFQGTAEPPAGWRLLETIPGSESAYMPPIRLLRLPEPKPVKTE